MHGGKREATFQDNLKQLWENGIMGNGVAMSIGKERLVAAFGKSSHTRGVGKKTSGLAGHRGSKRPLQHGEVLSVSAYTILQLYLLLC